MNSETVRRTGAVSVCALILALAGCVPASTTTDGSSSSLPEQVLASFAPRPPAAASFSEVETNDDYSNSQPVTIDGTADLVGGIRAGVIDRDLYELGSGAVGDRIQAELAIASGADIVLGILDGRGQLLGYLDLTTIAAGPRKLDLYLHEAAAHLFAIVTTRTIGVSDRAYTAHLTMERAVGVPDYRPQVVVLNFQGAKNVRIIGRGSANVPAFDAATLSARFAGQTDVVIQNILAMVSETFAGLGVQVFAAGDPAIPDGSHSTVYFGTYDSQLLGLADNIDPYNTNPDQSAILYTDTFALFDVLSPDVEAISQVLANTTSHEVGHLLGLRHTSDPHDIMDTTASARQMLVRQWFRTANLNSSVMNFGLQNEPRMLEWTVGGVLAPQPNAQSLATRQKSIQLASKALDFYIPRHQLIGGHCEACGQ